MSVPSVIGSREGFSALPRATGFLWIVGPLWYLVAEAISASAFRGYSYAANYISDLGVPEPGTFQGRALDSPLHAVMNAGFIGEAVLFLVGTALLAPFVRHRGSAALFLVSSALHAAGLVLVAVVPGSAANAANGLGVWHGVGAVAAILCGNLAAILSGWALPMSRRLRRTGLWLGAGGFVCVVLLLTHVLFPDGVWERGALYTFVLWQLVTGITLLAAGKLSR